MNYLEWDPLEYSEDNLDDEILSGVKKRKIKNILKSYVGKYDPFSELIQNAMDAVEKREFQNEERDFQKKLWLTVDLQQNKFLITDNGIGFKESEFNAFLAPDISFKDGDNTRGNKGVGATYLAYGFNYMQIGTKTERFSFTGKLEDGRKWLEDNKSLEERPKIRKTDPEHTPFKETDNGSTFVIGFGGPNTRPKKLTYFGAKNAEQWLFLLLIKTPLGNIDLFNEQKNPIKFDLKVIDSNGDVTEKNDQNCSYIYPHKHISSSVNLKEIFDASQKQIDKGNPSGALPKKYYRLNGIYEFFKPEDLKVLRPQKFTEEKLNLIESFEVSAYCYFCYSTSIWDEFNDRIAKLRKGLRIIRGGLQLSNNHMPQGDLISIPLTSNIGYQNQAHVLVHFKNADPDLGRKGFQPELKELGEEIAVGIVERFKKFKAHLRKDTGEKPKIREEIKLKNWISQQEKYEEEQPLKIKNENFFKPVNEVSITSAPQSEQDVIVLFNQLIAGGVIRGIKLLATSQIEQYDGVFRFHVKEPFENHEFNKQTNPLGIQELETTEELLSPAYVLEYKYNVDALMKEFENEEKKEGDINLIVAWELGDLWKRKYEVTSLLNFENLHHRQFHGITHLITGANNEIQAIILKELVAYLNEVDGVQEYHKQHYGDEI
jgi:hypothetical protein